MAERILGTGTWCSLQRSTVKVFGSVRLQESSVAGRCGISNVNLEPGNERACKSDRNLGLILEVVFRELKILFRNGTAHTEHV